MRCGLLSRTPINPRQPLLALYIRFWSQLTSLFNHVSQKPSRGPPGGRRCLSSPFFVRYIFSFEVFKFLTREPSSPNTKRGAAFAFGSEPVRGLNIGGWLVLEPWITPSVFRNLDQSLGIVDEYTLTEKLGKDAALSVLKPHVCNNL